MPVIVVGADAGSGRAIIDALLPRPGEVRAFVTSPSVAAELRELGVKVALGDVSDASHVEAAALRAFSAVLVTEAATDDRERAFITDASAVVASWFHAVGQAGVRRVITVDNERTPEITAELWAIVPEGAAVDASGRSETETGALVASLDEAATLPQ